MEDGVGAAHPAQREVDPAFLVQPDPVQPGEIGVERRALAIELEGGLHGRSSLTSLSRNRSRGCRLYWLCSLWRGGWTAAVLILTRGEGTMTRLIVSAAAVLFPPHLRPR